MKTSVIETIIDISEILKDSKLDLESLARDKNISALNDYFNTLTVETVILMSVFRLSSECKNVNREAISKYLNCSPILFYKYEANFDALIKNGFLEFEDKIFYSAALKQLNYKVHPRVHLSIINNTPLEPFKIETATDPIELLMALAEIINSREYEDVDTVQLMGVFHSFLSTHRDIPLFNNLSNMNLNYIQKIWLTLMIERNLLGKLNVEIDWLGNIIFSSSADKINFAASLHNKTNDLFGQNWINFSSGGYFSNARVQLTKKAKDFFKPLGIDIRLDEVENNDFLIAPHKISPKKLFYNAPETEQIASISNSLKFRNHQKIKQRLSSQGLRTGICTILYGAPGTGKTESVYQIAKQTGRPLWKVDLSELKSMWFGESQKKVKALFDNYKDLCKDQKRTPILLLNEADAILGTRKSSTESSSQSAENAIQNIFLDCLEDFEGILFATTNLEQSLDPAFERRFLFKIKFERPKAEAQQNIWKAMCPELNKTQAKTLSNNYDFSGGEIENVLRKLAMRRVLEEEVEIFDTVKTLCKNEQLGLKGKLAPIGYFN